jgi:hypothetical protein
MLELNFAPVAETPLVGAVADELSVDKTIGATNWSRGWYSSRTRYTGRCWKSS